MSMLKIGFIGAGKMAQVLANGFINAGLTKGEMLVASCLPDDETSINGFKGINKSKIVFSNSEVINHSDIIILAVKPQIIASILPEIKQTMENRRKLLLSIAMGISLETLENNLSNGTPVIRVMPNTPALVGCGATVYVPGKNVNNEHIETTKKLFSSVGICEQVPEKMIDVVTALAGSGPAYVYMMIEALADGAVKMGMPRTTAYRLASQTVLGAAKMVKETNVHPAILKDDVASPAGSTIAGIHSLEKNGFRTALISAVEAATLRCKEVCNIFSRE